MTDRRERRMTTAERVQAIVLAAGLGRRMGGPKHLLPVDGRPMLERVLASLEGAGLSRRLVVLRPDDEPGHALLARLGVPGVAVREPDEGRAASIRSGIAHAPPDAALLFALADQPWVEPDDFRALVQAQRDGAGIAFASYDGRRGSPVLFDARFREELLELQGEQGGRLVIERHPAARVGVPLEPRHGRDVDRPSDLRSPGAGGSQDQAAPATRRSGSR